MQAEAVNDLIDAVTPLQARTAFDQLDGTLTRAIGAIDATLFDLIARLEASVDFPEEGYHFVEPGALAQAIDGLLERTGSLLGDARRGRMIREGLKIAIVGEPNVGKSRLASMCSPARSRAIVTDVPGTTRDLVTELVDIEGLAGHAGRYRGASRHGRSGRSSRGCRTRAAGDRGSPIWCCVVEDRSRAAIGPRESQNRKVLYIAKQELIWPRRGNRTIDAVAVSATAGDGLDELRRRDRGGAGSSIRCAIVRRGDDQRAAHRARRSRASKALGRARAAVLAEGVSLPEEFVLADLSEARAAFEAISGRRAPEELLEHIFSPELLHRQMTAKKEPQRSQRPQRRFLAVRWRQWVSGWF